jgi:hypothetical protein
VNTHEKNYTKGKLARRRAHVEESIARYLAELEEADSAEAGPATPRIEHLTERLASLRGRLGELEEIGRQLQAAPDEQISLTDPDARAMATGSDHRGVVGYNVQAAVDTKHHIVVANAVSNRGHDRSHLLEMAKAAQAEAGASDMIALADRGYYEGEQIRSCAEAGIIPMVPKPNTSPAQARGFWGKAMFVHEPETDTYRCPVGEQLQKRFARVEGGKLIGVYFNQKACGACSSRPLCTAGKEKRIRRWEHERSSTRSDGAKAPSDARSNGGTTLHGRARLRHHKRLDGRHPLPNARAQKRRHRSQPGHPGLQHEASHCRRRRCLDPQSDSRMNGADARHGKAA